MLVLQAKNVTRVYGRRGAYATKALRGINLAIGAGEFVGVMGPSGSGKTTLLNALSGIDRPTSGEVEIMGKDICRLSDDELALFRRRCLGFVFQEYNLLDSLTAVENVMLPMVLDHKESAEMESRAREVMSFFGITDIADKFPYEISGGEQERTAVARAVINNPDIIFADEPTGNLDSRSASAVMECLETLNRDRHTILMVTHDASAASFASRVVFIKDGVVDEEIRRDGPRPAFFARILEHLQVAGLQ